MHAFACLAVTLATACLTTFSAQAQTYPDRPVRFIVGFPAGGGADILCRYFIDGMAKLSGGTFVTDNRPGASGNIGADAVAKAKPDGYTLLMGASSTQAGNPHVYKNLPWDPVLDFEPVSTFALVGYVLTVSANNPARSVADLTAQLKAKAGRATFAFGNTSSLTGASLYAQEAGLTLTSVPYKSSAQALSDVAEGQVDFMVSEPVLAIGQEKAGKVRNLAATAETRLLSLPALPTMKELGYPASTMAPWWALFAPARTPPEIIAKLEGWINMVSAMPQTKEFLLRQGLEPFPGTAASTRKHLAATLDEWARIVKIVKIEPQ